MLEKQELTPEKIAKTYKAITNVKLKKKAINRVESRTGLKRTTVYTNLSTGSFPRKHKEVVFDCLQKMLEEQESITV